MKPIVMSWRRPIGLVVLTAAGCFHTGGAAFAQTSPGTASLGDPFEVHGLLYSGSAPVGFPFGDGWAQGASFLGVLDENGNPAPNAAGIPFRAARFPIVQNATAAPEQRPDELRRNLVAQVCAPVRWIECGDTSSHSCRRRSRAWRASS